MSATVIVDGQKLRKLRESHSLSQEGLEFACSKKKGCSVSVATIKRAELGHPLSRRTVARLAQFFAVPIDALLLEQPSVPAFELSFVSDRQPCLLIWVQCTPRVFCQRVQSVLSRFMPVFTQSTGNTLVCAIPYVKGKRQYLALLSCVSDLLEVARSQSATLTVLVQMEALVSLGSCQWVLQDAVFDTLSQSAVMVPVGSLAVSEELVMLSRQYFEFNTEPKASRFYVLKHRFSLGRPTHKTVGRESEFLHWGHAVGAIEQSKQATVFSVSGLEGCGKTHVLQYFQQHDRVKSWRQVVVDLEMHQPASAVMIEVLRPALNELGLLGGAVVQDEPVLVILDNLHLVDSQGFSNLIDLIQETRKQPVLWLVAWAPTQQASSMLDELRCTGLKNTQLSLEPLQLHHLRALAMNEQLLSDEFLQAVYVHSAGNPYFFQELVKLAVDGVSVLKPAFQYSFDALNDDEKAVVALLSCSLHNLTVDDVLDFPHVTSETIHSLRALNWVRVSFRNTVSFVLDEARLVVQRSVSASVRERVYDWLASLMEVASNQDETMLWLKGEYNLGASHHMAAARSFFAYGQVWVRQYSYQQAIHWLNRSLDALALTEPHEESHLLMSDIRLSLARINSISRGWVSQSSMLAYQQCMNLSERHHCTLRHCVALVGVWVTQLMALDFRTSEKTAYDMLEQAQQGNEPFAVSLAHSCLSNTHFWLGQHDKAIEHAEQACLCYQDCKDAHLAEGIGFNPLGLACCFGALSASVMCNYQQMAFFRQYHSIDVISKSPFNQAIVIQGDIWCFYHQRDPEQVLLLSHDLVALSEKHNFPFYKGVAMLFLGWAQAVLHPEQAADQLQVVEEGYNYWLASSGDQIAHSLYALIKAEVFRAVGQRRQASEVLQHALDFALQKEEACYLAPLYARLGQLDKSRQVALAQGASLFLQPEWCVSSVLI